MASKIKINLDTNKENYLVTKCKQNDDIKLEAIIYENGLEKDLISAEITIQALKADNTYIIQNTDIYIDNNKITANLNRDFTRIPGITKIEIVLIESGKNNTTFSFYLEVVSSVINKSVKCNNTVTILEALSNKVVEAAQFKQETEELIKSGGAATKGDIQQVNLQLDQKAQKSEVDSLRNIKADKSNVYAKNETYAKAEVDAKVFSMANIGQDVKTAMTGGSVAVVGEGAVDTINTKDNAITFNKRTRLGEKVEVVCGGKIPDISYTNTNRKLTFYNTTSFYLGKKSYTLDGDISIELDGTSANYYIFINLTTGEFINKNRLLTLAQLSEDSALVCTISFTNALPSNSLKSFSINCDFTENLIPTSRLNNNCITTNMVDAKAITSSKKTIIGESWFITIGSPYKLPNIDLVNKKLQFFGQSFINWRNNRYQLNTDSLAITEIDFSDIWDNSTASVIITFNVVSKLFEVIPSNNYNLITEDSLIIASISKQGNTKEFLGLNCNFEYTINDEKANTTSDSNYVDNKYNLIVPTDIPNGWYKARSDIQGYEAESHYKDNITLQDIYEVYDNASTVYKDYVTKTTLGKDSTDAYDIFRYDFKPNTEVEGYNLPKRKLPKIFITTGTHGEEKSSVVSLRNFIDDLCNNWRNDELLEFIRWNVHLIIIPILNPYGFVKYQRKNGRGVDLNRNCSYNWELGSSDPTNQIYRGESAFSEKETQYVRDIIQNNKDITAFYDYHMNGTSGAEWKYSFWHYLEKINKSEELEMLSRNSVIKITNESQKRYGVPFDSGYIGYISYNNTSSTIAMYVNSEGIPACGTIECTRKLVGDEKVYSANVLKMCTEFIGNTILGTVRAFCK